MKDSVLVSFAILTTNWERRGKGFVDNFVPFAAECLKNQGFDPVSALDLQKCLEDDFGLRLPVNAIQTVLERCKRVGIVRVEHGVYRPVVDEVARFEVTKVRDAVLREYGALLDAFVAFCHSEHRVSINEEDADAALLTYLEGRALPVMRRMLGKDALPLLNAGEPGNEFLVASFVVWACERDPNAFSFLETVVRGSMLATALYLPAPADMGGPIKDLRVVLDTPFLLRALGLHGPSQAVAGTELLDMLRRLGARVECLNITLRETRGVLQACANSLRVPKRRGHVPTPVAEYCLENGLGPTDVEVLAERLEDDLRAIGVRVEDPPEVTAALSIDETGLETQLQASVGYQRVEARAHDAQCLAAIYRYRQGHSQRHIETARAVFVTTNHRVVRASRLFFGEKAQGDSVPVAALDHELGTVIWLKKPQKAPQFPRRLILADAYAALNPPDEVWEQYMAAVDRLEESGTLTDEDYVLLRYSVEARRALMDRTHGDTAAFSTATVGEILEKARNQAAADLAAQVEAAERNARTEREHREVAEKETATEVKRGTESRRRHTLKIERKAEVVAAVIAKICFWLLAVIAGLGVFLGLWPGVLNGRPKVIVAVLGLCLAVAVTLGLSGLLWGSSLRSIMGRFEAALARKLKRLFLQWFGP